jgi:two-component system chemotaxis response regulator CheY
MPRVLIIDDSKFMRKIIKETLVSGGFTIVDEADNGSDGIAKYIELKPDFVTMDITMGGLDGIEAIKAINKFDPKAKIIIISALNEKTIKMNENSIKASAYIIKPFEKNNLLDTIKELLA